MESLLRKSCNRCSGVTPASNTRGAVPKPQLANHFPASILSAVLGVLVVHHLEHVLGDLLTVLTRKLAHTSAEALRTPTRITADAGSEALACHAADSRCFLACSQRCSCDQCADRAR